MSNNKYLVIVVGVALLGAAVAVLTSAVAKASGLK